ncbi:hypothetical protein LPY66_07535 [Dehalobacter sp. DCM]|uniref:LytS/YhcK type 5TM receptor domain-containing protein n=1 Tax=Dehalobacter sp. DCM TaxID=2907827 RepID=UPI0030818C1D|nr:hypothetical protein LPY66_07535 [Dehalobacter sp. DCM]
MVFPSISVLIIASVTLGNLIVRDRILEFNTKTMLIISILTGILGCLLMVYSLRVTPSVIVDFRCIPIIIMGIYCSISASTIAALLIGLFRIGYFGLYTASVITSQQFSARFCGIHGFAGSIDSIGIAVRLP